MTAEIYSLREKARESWEHCISDVIVHLGNLSMVNDASINFPINFAAEAYAEGRIWCEVQLYTNGHDHYTAIIARDPLRNLKIKGRSLGKDNSMLTDIAESIELPKEIVFVSCPSMIWLKRLDLGQGGIELIQGRPETEYSITRENTPIKVDDGKLNAADIASIIRILIIGNTRWVQFTELAKFGVQNVEVFFRPIEPELGVFESSWHELYSNYERQEGTDADA